MRWAAIAVILTLFGLLTASDIRLFSLMHMGFLEKKWNTLPFYSLFSALSLRMAQHPAVHPRRIGRN